MIDVFEHDFQWIQEWNFVFFSVLIFTSFFNLKVALIAVSAEGVGCDPQTVAKSTCMSVRDYSMKGIGKNAKK